MPIRTASSVPSFPGSSTVDSFVVVDVDPAGLTAGSDGFPDAIFARDSRSHRSTASAWFRSPQLGHRSGLRPRRRRHQRRHRTRRLGVPYNCTFLFDPGRHLRSADRRPLQCGHQRRHPRRQRPDRTRRPASVDPAEGGALQHQPARPLPVQRRLRVFVEAKWTRVDAVGNNASPTGIQGTMTTFDIRERIRLDNPFLSSGDSAPRLPT